MDDHVSEAIARPDLIDLGEGLLCLRFESMKVASALAAVRHLLDTGVVRPGDTLLDSSSGIYAYGLALAAHRYGLRCHIVGSTTIDHPLRIQLAVLGATLERMPPSEDLSLDQNRRVHRIKEVLRENPHFHWMRQYHDAVHGLGYRAVADRILKEVGTGPLTLVGGVGSGASTGALARYVRESLPDTPLVGVQPFGSVTFGSDGVDDPQIIIAGIGSSIPFGNVDHTLYDTLHWTSFDSALSGSVDLLRRHAVFAGLSAGAAYLAARWEAARTGRRVVFVAADTGHRYVDSVFAHHESALPIDDLAPTAIDDLAGLAPPWCRMEWGRRPAPEQAVHRAD
ncbi:pyridoxal-phosphate dependent enzyme [Nocardiopsis alba]|uniref:Pyridoxal-phosphate dependent enzyme family protein n=1 Tax=Nocardiopsis alba (strain ATCC BAA-2165 / BE74) TaxID=1205910 RepID=J7LGM6_NOCAA|nr:pyridoxal-phosphate dependent enzyme [Nocardiopsis alba]AFR10610.1 pyridoxal-phosphate dependent enzyme family protein [Nocardiopsis alba ATCC BAA-2165]